MDRRKQLTLVVMLALLLLPTALFGQEEKVPRGMVEFGVRHVWGEVYGRPDLPFKPDILTSKYNEYRDVKNGFVVPRFYFNLDDLLGSKLYLNAQSQSTFYKNQSYLATLGEYGKFKVQFRYDEIPHTYSNTTRTSYLQTSRGVWKLPPSLRTTLTNASSIGTAAQINANLPPLVATQVVPGENFIVPSILRKAGTGLVSYNFTPDFNLSVMYTRENQVGTRPIGLLFNPSPSASATGLSSGLTGTAATPLPTPGTGVELPETIDYYTNTVRPWIEYGKEKWVVQAGYTGSFFQNNTSTMLFENPFATGDVPVRTFAAGESGCAPTGTATRCSAGAVPNHGALDLYPDNRAHYLNFAAGFDLTKYLRIQGTVNPGWLRQNDPFLPYTTNTAITGIPALPASSLNGDKQTLAMNWTAVLKPINSIQIAAKYRHYDYNNHTPSHEWVPILGDTIGANSTATAQLVPGTAASGSGSVQENEPFGFNRKTFEVTGNWFFAKRSTVKVGYEHDLFDREHRDVRHSVEKSVFGGVDFSPTRDLLFSVAVRHQNREPEEYQDPTAEAGGVEIPCDSASVAFTEEQRCHRRFDEASRLLYRADAMVQYSLQKFTFSATYQTIQADYNRRGGVNSPVPLNPTAGLGASLGPYYLYGALKDLSFIYGAEVSYGFSNDLSLFAEYTHERYHKRMVSRNRAPTSGAQTILTCTGCDTNNNDWESTYRDIFNTYAAGFDASLGKKINVSAFYSLSDGPGNVITRFLGDPAITTGANAFTLNNTSAAVSYPETTTRIHELAAVFRFKLTKNIVPKFEYRFQQFDNKDYQTSVMTPYMGCASAAPPTPVVGAPCNQRILINTTPSPTPTFNPNNPSYPFFVVGDNSAARYLFLGVDQPSYRSHYVAATVEWHF